MKHRFLLVFTLLLTSLTTHAAGVGTIFNGLIGYAVGKAAASQLIEKSLVETADIVNKQLPMTINTDTRYDKVIAGPGHRFTHYYTLLNTRTSDIDKSIFDQDSFPKLRNAVCTDPDSQPFVKNGVVVSFSYRGNDGRTISTVDIAPSDCR